MSDYVESLRQGKPLEHVKTYEQIEEFRRLCVDLKTAEKNTARLAALKPEHKFSYANHLREVEAELSEKVKNL